MLKKACKGLISWAGYMLYALVLLLLALWLLFPRETLRRQLVQYLDNAYPELNWQVQSLALQIPEGMVLQGIKGCGKQAETPLVQLDTLVLRPCITKMLHTRRLEVEYRILVGKGIIGGNLQKNSGTMGWHFGGTIRGGQLAEYSMLSRLLQRNIEGIVTADFGGTVQPSPGGTFDLEANLRIENGRLGLKQPIFEQTSLPFSQITIGLHTHGATLHIEQGVIESELLSGQCTGEIYVEQTPAASRLDIRGTLQPQPFFFKSVTNARILESVRAQLAKGPLPFQVSGELHNPGIHFEEFSLLFQSLEEELE